MGCYIPPTWAQGKHGHGRARRGRGGKLQLGPLAKRSNILRPRTPAKIDLIFPDPRQNQRKSGFSDKKLKKMELDRCELDDF